MDQKLKLQHEVETCLAIAGAVSAMLNEIVDEGVSSGAKVGRAAIVHGLLQDKLDMVKEMADNAVLDGLA